jgi:hypothetical protein
MNHTEPENSILKGSEWLKNLENHSNPGSKCASRESTQISMNSESPSESGPGNLEDTFKQDKRKSEMWDSSKKRKTKKGGLAEKWEEMLKNESSDRALKEHFKEKDGIMGIAFGSDLVPLIGTIINYEIGLDNLVRFRCHRDIGDAKYSVNRIFTSITTIFEVLLNKDEIDGIDFSETLSKIELNKPFVEVNINDYYADRQNETLTLITNPSIVKVS